MAVTGEMKPGRKQRPLLALVLLALAIVILVGGLILIRQQYQPTSDLMATALNNLDRTYQHR